MLSMKRLIIISFLITLNSCYEDEIIIGNRLCCISPSTHFSFSIQNKDGVDLLNPDNDLSFKHDEIEVYESEKLVEEITSKWSVGEELQIFKSEDDGIYRMSLRPSYLRISKINDSMYVERCVLKLSDSTIDKLTVKTVVAEAMENLIYLELSSILYNDSIIFDALVDLEKKRHRGIIIIK